MKTNFFLVLLLFTLVQYACKKGGGQTISGHRFEIIENADGPNAVLGDYVYFHYSVRANDSTVFNSMVQGPIIRFKMPEIKKADKPINSQPVLELLSNLSKGDSAVVYQVVDDEIKAQIRMDNVKELAYHVRLIDIKDEAAYEADMKEEQRKLDEKFEANKAKLPMIESDLKTTLAEFKSGSNKDQVITTASGLKYIVHSTGSGPKAETGKAVSVNYYGCLMDGTRFDDSWSQPQDFTFVIGSGQVIPGWDEGVALLNEGSKATFIIPYALAYGEAGRPPVIPEKSDLVFYIEVNKVN